MRPYTHNPKEWSIAIDPLGNIAPGHGPEGLNGVTGLTTKSTSDC